MALLFFCRLHMVFSSPRHLMVAGGCIIVMEIIYKMDFSLAGFLICCLILGFRKLITFKCYLCCHHIASDLSQIYHLCRYLIFQWNFSENEIFVIIEEFFMVFICLLPNFSSNFFCCFFGFWPSFSVRFCCLYQ